MIGLCAGALLTGCAGVPERNALTEDLADIAEIPGIPGARQWGDTPPNMYQGWYTFTKEELREFHPDTFGERHNYLAISGGGAFGAYAAGVLNGWTEAGTRPEFTIVTGVSTGALIAPFAFLGPKYDDVIKVLYTQTSTEGIMEKFRPLQALFGESGSKATPLQKKLENYVTQEVMEELAAEFRRGRVLTIGTTHLDAGRPVAWNITRIAASGAPGSLELIRKIMLASASIPGTFPPVMFDIDANGTIYDEMHVDGGVSANVYFYPIGLDWDIVMERLEVKGTPNLYVIINSHLTEGWHETQRSTLDITERSVSTLLNSATRGEVYRIYLGAKRDGINFKLGYVPTFFNLPQQEFFDAAFMTELYILGYDSALEGYKWESAPPGANGNDTPGN